MAKTSQSIKDTLKEIRKIYGIKATIKSAQHSVGEMEVRVRKYGEDYFVDYPSKTKGWRDNVYKLLLKNGVDQEFFVDYPRNPYHAIGLRKKDA